MSTSPLAAWALVGLLVVGAAPLQGQFPGSRGPGAREANAFVVGARGGYDFGNDGPVLGAFVRSSLAWRLSAQARGDFIFLDGLTEREAGADLLVRISPGFHVGGGVVIRNSIYALQGGERENRTGGSVAAFLGGLPGAGRVVTGIELRLTQVGDFDSQILTFQVGLPLLRW